MRLAAFFVSFSALDRCRSSGLDAVVYIIYWFNIVFWLSCHTFDATCLVVHLTIAHYYARREFRHGENRPCSG